MNIFSFLFQPDKSKLSPAGRAFIAWLEIIIISVPPAGAGAGLEYLNGHPGDWAGLVQFMIIAMIIATLKGFTTLGVSMKNTSVTQDAPAPAPPAPQPPVVIHNMLPAMPEPQIVQVATPVPTPVSPPVPQFKAPLPAVPDMNTNVMPTILMPNGRDWTGLELPAVQP